MRHLLLFTLLALAGCAGYAPPSLSNNFLQSRDYAWQESEQQERPVFKPLKKTVDAKNKQKTAKISKKSLNKVASIAEDDVGQYYKPDQTAQCSAWVRDVIAKAGYKVEPAVTAAPLDDRPVLGGVNMANSFGADQGKVVYDEEAIVPGSIVLFKNTYGNWKPGSITHVGVAIGRDEEGRVVVAHRSTSKGRKIAKWPLDSKHFAAAVIPRYTPVD
jgi:hypothetical protein